MRVELEGVQAKTPEGDRFFRFWESH